MAKPGAGPIFDDRSFPDLEAKERFSKALRLAENAVSYMDGPIYPQGTPRPGNNKEKDVLLSQVVAFFVGCEWAGIPEQLHATVQAAVPVAQLEPASYAPIKKDGYILKKAAMVKKYSDTWETIEADFNHASENGLTEAAKATGHGDWFELAALQWADQRAKRTEPIEQSAPNSIFNVPGKKHTIKG